MKKSNIQITEDDLAIFPPGLSYFLLVTFLMIFSHATAALLVFHFLLALQPGPMILSTVGSVIFIVIFNILIIRGYPIGAKCHYYLAFLYTGIGLAGLKDHTSLALIPTALSITAVLILRSQKYQSMVFFMEKRWSFYRQTGRTLLEEYYLQKLK